MNKNILVLFVFLVLGPVASLAFGGEKEIAIMLGGEGCESHPEQITKALMAQKGVVSVDMKKLEGHAVVKTDGTANPDKLVEAIQGLKGGKDKAEWHCEAMIMN